jgi:hypothetical protein
MAKAIEGRVMEEVDFKADFTPQAFDGFKTKSEEIRARSKSGQSRSVIAKAMGIRYQHVRNVLLQPLKRA